MLTSLVLLFYTVLFNVILIEGNEGKSIDVKEGVLIGDWRGANSSTLIIIKDSGLHYVETGSIILVNIPY